MEYKVLMNGRMVWNKLEGGSVLPTQVSFSLLVKDI